MSEKLSEQFAALIAEYHRQYAARESLTSNGHRCSDLVIHNADTILSALRVAEAQSDAVKAEVEAEREACAKVAGGRTHQGVYREWPGVWDGDRHYCSEIVRFGDAVAAAIRARSSAPPVNGEGK